MNTQLNTNVRHHRRLLLGILGLLTVIGVMIAPTAGIVLAVHDIGLFQLDYTTSPLQGAANVSSTNISPADNTGDDWDKFTARPVPSPLFCPGSNQAADPLLYSVIQDND
jgi:hypothetical protein